MTEFRSCVPSKKGEEEAALKGEINYQGVPHSYFISRLSFATEVETCNPKNIPHRKKRRLKFADALTMALSSPLHCILFAWRR